MACFLISVTWFEVYFLIVDIFYTRFPIKTKIPWAKPLMSYITHKQIIRLMFHSNMQTKDMINRGKDWVKFHDGERHVKGEALVLRVTHVNDGRMCCIPFGKATLFEEFPLGRLIVSSLSLGPCAPPHLLLQSSCASNVWGVTLLILSDPDVKTNDEVLLLNQP
jgi:hypothetical protein